MTNVWQLRSTLLVLLLTVLTACSHLSLSATGTSTLSSGLRVGSMDEPDSLNPLFAHTAVADDVAALLFAPLFRYDPRGDFVPELATVVPSRNNGDVSPDGLRVTLRLRQGLHWADGAPLDMRDLRFTWHAIMNNANAVKLRAGWDNIRALETPNPQTAIIHLQHPDATILGLFAGGGDAAYPLLPEHLLGRLDNLNQAAFNSAPLSSGPWRLAAWNHGSDLRFEPNPQYWRGRPHLRAITLLIRPDAQALVTALQTRDIDMAFNITPSGLRQLATVPGLVYTSHAVAAYRHLDFNCRDTLLRDVRMRTAINAAINWPRILHVVYHDDAQLAQSDIFPNSWAAPRLPPYAVDPSAAARMLEAMGWHVMPNGTRSRRGQTLEFTLLGGQGNPLSAQVETFIASDLQAIGITVVSKNAPASYLFAENGPLYGGRYQMAWMSDTRAPDPDNFASWDSLAMPPHGGNTVRLQDDIVDHFASEGRRLNDRVARAAAYQAEEARLHLLLPSRIFAWQRETIVSVGPIRGLRPATYYSNFWNSWAWHR